MRFTTSLFLGFSLALAGTFAAAAAPATTRAATNVRGGPGTNYAVLGTVPAGTPVDVVGCAGAWCQTQYGYVSANLLVPAAGAALGAASGGTGAYLPAPAPVTGASALGYAPAGAGAGYSGSPATAAGDAYAAAHPGDDLTMAGVRTTMGTTNVRSGPGTEYDVIKTLPDSTSVQVSGCANSWCQTNEGYISVYLLSRGAVQQQFNAAAQPRLPGSQTQSQMASGVTSYGASAYGAATPALAAATGAVTSGTANAVMSGTANAVTSGTANVRSGPGTRYGVLGTLPAGTPVSVVGCSGSWCQTQYGYVSAGLIRTGSVLGPTATPLATTRPLAAAPYAAPSYAVPSYTTGTVAAAAPSSVAPRPVAGAAALGYAPAGAGASSPISPATAAGDAYAAAHPGDDLTMAGVRTTMGTTNVRAGPGTEYEVVKTLPDSTSVQVSGCANSWCQTNEGYISVYLLSRGAVEQQFNAAAQPRLPGSQTQSQMASGVTAYGASAYGAPAYGAAATSALTGATGTANAVTSATANVRSGPGTRYGVLGTLPAGTPVSVVGCSGSWCQTQYGYVSAGLIAQSAPSASIAPYGQSAPAGGAFAASPGRAYAPGVSGNAAAIGPAGAAATSTSAAYTATTTAAVNVRSGPGTGYDVIATVPAGTRVGVRSCSGSWCETDYGYISARHLSGGSGASTQVLVRPSQISGGAYSPAADASSMSDASAMSFAAVSPGYTTTAPYPGPIYPGIATTTAPTGGVVLAGLAAPFVAPFVGLAAAADMADGTAFGSYGAAGMAPFGYGWGTVWRASWGPGYWGPGLYGRNGASYWGARTSYWGGRTSFANMHPGYPNIARFGDRNGDTYWSRRGEGRLPQRASFYSGGLGPYWQGPYAEGPAYNGRPVMWRPRAAIW